MFYRRICNIAIFISALLVFITWTLINNINFSFLENNQSIPNDFISFLNKNKFFITLLISFISAHGFFNLFVSIIIWLLEKTRRMRKIILGSLYFEGTWIGYYHVDEGKPVVFFQTIEQDIDNIRCINTEAFHKDDKTYRCRWYSIGKVAIDYMTSSFSYIYYATVVNNDVDGKRNARGFFTSSILKKGCLSNPYRISGEAFNTATKNEMRMVQIKDSDMVLIDSKEYINELINKAICFYESENNKK